MKSLNILLFVILVTLGLNSINGQTLRSQTSNQASKAFIAPKDHPICSPLPTQEQVNTGPWKYIDHFYSYDQALKAGIPLINLSGSHNLKVYVKDYRRAVSCQATDNKKTLYYGQVIRSVIEIENWNASVDVSLPSIAANGTLNKNIQHFYLYKDGFFNPKIDGIIATISGKVFDVENYALYQNVMPELLKIIDEANTVFSVNLVDMDPIPLPEDETLHNSPIIAYTLMNIKRGLSYNKTKIKFIEDPDDLKIVESTYNLVGALTDDSKPSELSILKAKGCLHGIKVKKAK